MGVRGERGGAVAVSGAFYSGVAGWGMAGGGHDPAAESGGRGVR
jgi:hypothetical protein